MLQDFKELDEMTIEDFDEDMKIKIIAFGKAIMIRNKIDNFMEDIRSKFNEERKELKKSFENFIGDLSDDSGIKDETIKEYVKNNKTNAYLLKILPVAEALGIELWWVKTNTYDKNFIYYENIDDFIKNIKIAFNDKLRESNKDIEKLITELVDKSGVARKTIRNYTIGKKNNKNASMLHILQVAEALGLTFEWTKYPRIEEK